MDGEERPRRGEPEGAVCLAHRGPAGTVPGGAPSTSRWQRERGGGCQPDTEGPCEPRSRLDLVQACEGKPLESCEFGRDTFQTSSLRQEASGRHSSEILDYVVLRGGRRHEAAEPAFLTSLVFKGHMAKPSRLLRCRGGLGTGLSPDPSRRATSRACPCVSPAQRGHAEGHPAGSPSPFTRLVPSTAPGTYLSRSVGRPELVGMVALGIKQLPGLLQAAAAQGFSPEWDTAFFRTEQANPRTEGEVFEWGQGGQSTRGERKQPIWCGLSRLLAFLSETPSLWPEA
ncbi:unnamed protein product [Rangifer tarandus platyrhynchus]|uniref:Uncharacterized protein n=1 Tax=Rangifer tarandus platyrhynchus TaxID=3082113 RepID=A0AC59YEY5_RANTA